MHPSPNTLSRPDLIVFDMDGTLVDVSESYREVAAIAAGRYLQLLGLTPPALTGQVYDEFKRMSGFNDDWDLTAGLLRVLLAPLPAALPLPAGPWHDQAALVAALRAAARPLAGLTPPLPDWEPLIAQVRAAGGGPAGLDRVIPPNNAHLVRRSGDAATTDLVQRVFSELYLGEQVFAAGYGYPAAYHRGPGLIERERLLINPDVLSALGQRFRLGVATGRTRIEVAAPLAQLGLGRFLSVVMTMNDALDAQTAGGETLLKPHPYLLHRAADALDPGGRRLAAYVGDAPDDVIAARRADGVRPWQAIALANTPAQRAYYLSLGADVVLDHPDELLGLW
jgi:HAD superfamily hydrolase (TIGR01548 family)